MDESADLLDGLLGDFAQVVHGSRVLARLLQNLLFGFGAHHRCAVKAGISAVQDFQFASFRQVCLRVSRKVKPDIVAFYDIRRGGMRILEIKRPDQFRTSLGQVGV